MKKKTNYFVVCCRGISRDNNNGIKKKVYKGHKVTKVDKYKSTERRADRHSLLNYVSSFHSASTKKGQKLK